MFQKSLALELLDVSFYDSNNVSGGTVRGKNLIQGDTKLFFAKNPTSDTEGFTTRSESGDIVVAFRGSETSFFTHEGAFKDWILTDFRSGRMPYPPNPATWPNRTWVHRGIWEAYDPARLTIIRDVQRLIDLPYPPGTSRKIYVTGFSLGGALALLAAIDLSGTIVGVPVELYSFAAPRVGDSSLNKLLAERVAQSFVVGFGGDPVIHVPPIGPNFPITFAHPVAVRVGPVRIPIGNPVEIQFGQQYRTADTIIYIRTNDRGMQFNLPFGMVALRFQDHDHGRYREAIAALSGNPTFGRRLPGAPMEPVLQMMLSNH